MNDESIIPELFKNIKQICRFLPCPECSQDATIMLNQIDINKIKSKQDFKDLLFVFHNMVNKKKHKRMLVSYTEIQSKYATQDLSNVFTTFLIAYNTTGNFKLMAEEGQRKMIRASFGKWLFENRRLFVKK